MQTISKIIEICHPTLPWLQENGSANICYENELANMFRVYLYLQGIEI